MLSATKLSMIHKKVRLDWGTLSPENPHSRNSHLGSEKEDIALLDLLLLARYSDLHLSIEEENIIHDLTNSITWDSTNSRDHYLNNKLSHVRNVRCMHTLKFEFIRNIAARLTNTRLRNSALEKLETFLHSDGLHEAEESFLIDVKRHFHAVSLVGYSLN